MKRLVLAAAITAATAALLAWSPAALADHHEAKAGAIAVSQPWARATAPGAPAGAAYLTVTNSGKEADRLIAASTPAAKTAELHTHIHDNGVMRMRQVEAIDVPAGGTVALKPGGLHVMLMGLTAPLAQGSSFDVTLTFEKAGKVTVPVAVQSAGAAAPTGHTGH